MSNAIVAWLNYVTSGTLTAGSAATNMSAQQLADDSGSSSVAWQTVSGVLTSAGGATVTITAAATGSVWRVFGLFRTNLTSSAAVSFALYTNPSTLVWQSANVSPVAGYRQVVAVAPSNQVADYCVVSINDSGNPDGFINVPLAFAGPAWFLATGPSWQTTVGRDSQVDNVVSRGGQEYPYLRWERRHWAIALDGIRATELWADIGEIDRISRLGGNLLFIPDIASAYVMQEAAFGRLQATADVSFPYQGADRRAWRATLTERI